MADNIAITPGSGANVRTDDVGGIQYQVVKFDFGGDGVSQLPDTNSGNKSAGTLRVVLATDQPALSTPMPVSGTVTATLGANVTEDAASAGAETAVLIAGVRNDAAATKTSADGDFGNIALDLAGRIGIADLGGSITVDGTVTTTPPSNASTNVAQLAGTTTDTNSGTKSAGTLRVVLATDQPQLTNKLLVTPDANAQVDLNKVAGTAADVNSGNKSAGTLRVTLATDQVQLTNALKVDPSAVTSPVSIAAVVDTKSSSAGKTPLFASVSVAASGATQIVAADATKKIKVVSYVLVADAAVTAKWQSATNDKSGAMSLAANGGVSAVGSFDAHILETAVNEALNLNLGGAIGVRGHISYFLET